MRCLFLAGAFLLASSPVLGQEEDPRSRGGATPLYRDPAAIAALVGPLCDAIEKTGLAPARKVAVKVISRDELAPFLRQDLEPEFRAVIPDVTQTQLDEILQSSVRFYAAIAMCKYGFATDEIYVVPETIEDIARVQPGVKVLDPEFFRAVFLHELVHACDDAAHDLGRRVAAVRNQDELQALNALVEGHAQAVTRQVLKAEGKEAWFAELEKVAGAEPAGVDATMQYVLSYLVADAKIYADALRFFDAMARRSPAPGFAELLEKPPKSLDAILFPERYGRIEPPPALAVGDALERFAQVAHRTGWSSARSPLSLLKLRSALALLPRPDVDGMLAGVRSAENVILTPPEADGSRALGALVIECSGEEAGRAAYALFTRLLKLKDDVLKTGALRIASSAYDEPKVIGAERAIHSRKEVAIDGYPEPLIVHGLIFQHGAGVIELTCNGLDLAPEELTAWAEEMLTVLDLPK